MKWVPGLFGMDCDSAALIPKGFGDNYVTARETIGELQSGLKVRASSSYRTSFDITFEII